MGKGCGPVLVSGIRELRTFISVFRGSSVQDIIVFGSAVASVTLLASQLDLAGKANVRTFSVWKGAVVGNIAVTQSWKASIASLSVGIKLLIVSLTTLSVAYLRIRGIVKKIENSISSLTHAQASVGELFRFDEALGRARRFSDLTVSELGRAANAFVDARKSIENEITAIANEFNIPAIELAFLDTSEVVHQYARHGIGIDELIEKVDKLKREYNFATKTIDQFRERIKELNEDIKETTRVTTPLVVEIARINSRLQRARSDTQRSLREPARFENYRDRVDAIRSAVENEIAVLRERAATETRLLEETEEDKVRVQARTIEIQTRLRADIERLQQRSEDRITQIIAEAGEERLQIEERVLTERYQAYQQFHANVVADAFAQGRAQVAAFVSSFGGIGDSIRSFTENVRSGVSEGYRRCCRFSKST